MNNNTQLHLLQCNVTITSIITAYTHITNKLYFPYLNLTYIYIVYHHTNIYIYTI